LVTRILPARSVKRRTVAATTTIADAAPVVIAEPTEGKSSAGPPKLFVGEGVSEQEARAERSGDGRSWHGAAMAEVRIGGGISTSSRLLGPVVSYVETGTKARPGEEHSSDLEGASIKGVGEEVSGSFLAERKYVPYS
jgi:hypothetical protein